MPNLILVTGASSDVGALLVRRLLAKNPQDIIAAQGHKNLALLAPIAQEYPGRLRTFSADLSSPEALGLFLESVERIVGAPSQFVHLPALPVQNTKFKNFDEERFERDMQVQLGSAVAICKRFAPAMAKQQYGRILFMLTSYILGAPPKYTAAYIMAKQALHGLAKSLAVEYAKNGVTVNCVAPAMIETKFLAETPDLVVQASAEANPMGRNATPEDVVPAMEFLLSDDAAFITGVTLPITGGSAIL